MNNYTVTVLDNGREIAEHKASQLNALSAINFVIKRFYKDKPKPCQEFVAKQVTNDGTNNRSTRPIADRASGMDERHHRSRPRPTKSAPHHAPLVGTSARVGSGLRHVSPIDSGLVLKS